MLARRHALTWSALLVVAACGPGAGGGGGDDTTGPGQDSGTQHPVDDGGGSSGYMDNAFYTPLDGGGADASCGAQTVPIATVHVVNPPDMLIVLDRSGSMADLPQIPGFPLPHKWTDMKTALKQITADQQMNIKFGFTAFPSDMNCAVPPSTIVGMALNDAPQIGSWLDTNSPQGSTPTPDALMAAKNIYAAAPVNPNGRYVILATDGDPNCGGPNQDQDTSTESLAAVTALASAGIKTFVIGVGDGFDTAGIQFLNDAATAGQTARAGSTKYYPAANQSDLQTSFNAITGAVARPTCTYALASAPPVPNDVSVNLGGTPVARSTMHTDGWDYSPDATHITFFGNACTQVMSGAASSVSFIYGCPGPKIN